MLTDGITEAENEQGEDFGMERLMDVLDTMRNVPLNEATQKIMREVEGWCGNAGMRDDASILACQIGSDEK